MSISGGPTPSSRPARRERFGLRFVIAITLFVVGFAALVAFVMYWLAPIQ